MIELLKLLREHRTWSIEALAQELDISPGQVKRQMEFLEHTGFLCRTTGCGHDCKGCSAHCGAPGGQSGMPVFWEVVQNNDKTS